jgi:hypothetical protein
VNQSSWIYRFEATAFCCILCNAVVEDKATLGSDLSATTPATSILAVTFLLPPIYDYAGAHNALNPVVANSAGPQVPRSRAILIAPSIPSTAFFRISQEFCRFFPRLAAFFN